MRSKHSINDNLNGYIFLLPSLSFFLVFMAFPVIFSLFLSFCEWDLISGFGNIKFIGVENFLNLFISENVLASLNNTLFYTIIVVPATLIIALVLAILVNNGVFLKKLIRLGFFMPYIASLVAVSTVWIAMFDNSRGPVNQILRALGVENPPTWLASPDYAFWVIILLSVWTGVGYCLVIYMAALQNVPQELYEASRVDGANSFSRFWNITVPMISPTTFFLVTTRIIASFQVFTPVKLMTQGGPVNSTSVIVFEIYREAFAYYKMGYSSAIAWILFVLIFVVTIIQWKFQGKWVNY